MRVSIVVPVFNASRYIERCARSLFEQTYKDIEYIFVNDASTDDSIEKLKSIINDYPHAVNNAVIINSEINKGCPATRTRGMKAATGDYLISVDSDDYVDLRFIELMANKAIETNADVVVCDMYYDYGSKIDIYAMAHASTPQEGMVDLLTGKLHGSLCNKLIRVSIFREHDLYCPSDISMGEDKYVSLGVFNHAASVAYVDKPLFYYNKVNDSSMSSLSKSRLIPSFVRLTEYINSQYGVENAPKAIKEGIRFHKAKIIGHVALYGQSLSQEQREVLGGVSVSDFLKHPLMPLHYRVAGIAYIFKLDFVITFLRSLIRRLRK